MFDDSGWLKHVESGLTSSHLAGSWGGKCCFQFAWHHCCHLAALQGCMGKMHWFLIKIPSPTYGLWKDVFLNAETSSKMIENDARWYIFQVSSSHVFYHFAGSAMVFRGMTRRGSIVQVCIAALPDGELKRIKDSFATGYPQSRNWWLCCCYQWPSKDVSSVSLDRTSIRSRIPQPQQKSIKVWARSWTCIICFFQFHNDNDQQWLQNKSSPKTIDSNQTRTTLIIKHMKLKC